MKQVLPIIIICAVGLAFCFGFLIAIIVKHFRTRFGKKEEFEMDDSTLVIPLEKKDFRK